MFRPIHTRAFLPLLVLLSGSAVSQADDPNERGSSQVPDRIPLIPDEPPAKPKSKPAVIQVKIEKSRPNGTEAFDKMIKSARAKYAKVNDYTAMLVRQERVDGNLLPTQVVEFRFRKNPLSINTRVVAPKELAGEETNFLSTKSDHKVMFQPGGMVDQFYRHVNLDDPIALKQARHPITEYGIAAMLDHVERIVAVEKRLSYPVEIFVTDSIYDGAACQRYEIITPRPHPGRYVYRSLLFINSKTKLPVRYESYIKPDVGMTTEESLMETQSLLNTKTNVRLGNAIFQR